MSKNNEIELLGFDKKLKSRVGDIQIFRKSVPTVSVAFHEFLIKFLNNQHFQAVAGDNVGVMLRQIRVADVVRGMLVCAAGSEEISNQFDASMYLLAKNEGGRHSPLSSKYAQQLYSRTWNVHCRIDISKNRDMSNTISRSDN